MPYRKICASDKLYEIPPEDE